jgi:hypothetical protein
MGFNRAQSTEDEGQALGEPFRGREMAKVIKDVVNIIKEALEDEGFQVIIDYVI